MLQLKPTNKGSNLVEQQLQTLTEQFQKHKQEVDASMQVDIIAAMENLLNTYLPDEVKQHLEVNLPTVIQGFVKTKLEGIFYRLMWKTQFTITTKQTEPSSLAELKRKMRELYEADPEATQEDQDLYNALLNSIKKAEKRVKVAKIQLLNDLEMPLTKTLTLTRVLNDEK